MYVKTCVNISLIYIYTYLYFYVQVVSLFFREDSHFDTYLSNGLTPPPSTHIDYYALLQCSTWQPIWT